PGGRVQQWAASVCPRDPRSARSCLGAGLRALRRVESAAGMVDRSRPRLGAGRALLDPAVAFLTARAAAGWHGQHARLGAVSRAAGSARQPDPAPDLWLYAWPAVRRLG